MNGASLGRLVQKFTGELLTSRPSEGENAPGAPSAGRPSAEVAWASIRFNLSMSPEDNAHTKAGLAELLALRNDLVHHLMERFDIFDENGCRAASSHLDICREKIDGHLERLQGWATSVAQSQALALSFMQSKAFEDVFLHGINPDGTVCWARATIVECLREAETACQVDGWTALDAALRFISKENQDQIPSKYGCKTWRQILTQSGQFELRRGTGSDRAPGQRYRSLAKDTAPAPSRPHKRILVAKKAPASRL